MAILWLVNRRYGSSAVVESKTSYVAVRLSAAIVAKVWMARFASRQRTMSFGGVEIKLLGSEVVASKVWDVLAEVGRLGLFPIPRKQARANPVAYAWES